MLYDVKWLVPNYVALTTYMGDQTPDSMRASFMMLGSLIDSSPQEIVHNIADTRKVTYSLPIQDMVHIVREFDSKSVVSGWSLTVGHIDVAQKLAIKISRSLIGNKVESFRKMSEAIDFLKRKDPAIDWATLDTSLFEAQ